MSPAVLTEPIFLLDKPIVLLYNENTPPQGGVKPSKKSGESLETKIQGYRHDLLSMLGPRGKGRKQAGGRPQSGGQSDDELYEGGL